MRHHCLISSIRHVGDPVWRELGGDVFSNAQDAVDSFNVYSDDSDVIQAELEAFVSSSSTDVLVVHSLLVDHNAHKTGTSSPSNPHIRYALRQFNRHIEYLLHHLPPHTLLLVFGDHGLSKWGNHGGATHDEVTTGLCAVSSSYSLHPFAVRAVRSVDI